jgi:ribosomal protein L37E
MQVEAICQKCGKKITLNSNTLKKEQYVAEGEKVLWLTFYDCERCGKRHFVQADDSETIRLFGKSVKCLKEIMKERKKFGCASEKQSAKFKSITKKLEGERLKLMVDFTDKPVESVREYVEHLKFSI